MTAIHAGTQEAKLTVRTFTLNNRKEIISKIVREVLVLFKVETVGRQGEADYLQLSVINHRLPDTEDGRVVIESKLMLFDLAVFAEDALHYPPQNTGNSQQEQYQQIRHVSINRLCSECLADEQGSVQHIGEYSVD